ncbi:MAG: asparagine synthase (glutamine-hydrolyzing) [Lachnospiraceae bacterium]|nr:asparagine synthase (glutamine-hydrolyzing) [Lachnospiraceae bacterium]
MCGICGVINIKNNRPVDRDVLGRMLEKIRHRGPDGSDSFIDEHVGLGFNRLSFIDLTGGMQPISNEDDSIVMVCNGEIFNYKELQSDLRSKGHSFKTETDVEVIIHLYEDMGDAFINELNGQFAICLYDKKKNSVLLVRDHVGICPLFYTVFDGRLIFASEIKAILEYPNVPRKLNLKAVDQLLNFPGVVSPNTFFKDIFSVKPGHFLDINDGRIADKEFWDLIYDTEDEDKGVDYYIENLRELIKNAVSRRLIADVPIGFYVSGGLDSSVVACYIGKFLLNSYYSFSAEIGSGDLNEKEFQRMVSECVKSEHYKVTVAEEEIWDNFASVIYHAESGVKESYDNAAFLLSKLVSESPAKAVLTGQGADEYFYGYVGYMVDAFRNMQKGKMTAEEQEINERLWGDPFFRFERDHDAIGKIHRQLYSADVLSEYDSFSAVAESPIDISKVKGLSTMKRRSYIDNKLRLSDHLLGEHGDRMFFSHSVEGRHPFLDREVIEFVRKIPDKYKLRGVNEKYILKRAGEGIVPEPILKRKKFPFQAPGMSAMIKKRPGHATSFDMGLVRKQGIFNPDFVQKLKDQYEDPEFVLMGAYEIDYLLIVMTVTMLCEQYNLTV